jgi:uracil phosphoribosyltransferase
MKRQLNQKSTTLSFLKFGIPFHSLSTFLTFVSPQDIAKRFVLLLDPMLATGGSCCAAIDVLKNAGVPENQILFLNMIAAPEGIEVLCSQHPDVTIITTEIDECLNEKKFIMPGIGDFGDRYFGTVG